MDRIDKLRNLLVMAAADGSLSESEIKYLTSRCRRWGLDDAEFASAVEYALSPDAEFTIPPRHSDRIAVLKDLIGMMAADGTLADVELNLFALVAAKMGISEDQLNGLIDSLVKPGK
jgi:uncharacterized tellurite resistance protein B-like protein